MSQFFASGDQSTGASASASVLVNTQGGFPLGRTSWISLQSKGVLFLFLSFFKFYMDLNTTGSITGKDLAKSSFCFKDFFLRCTNLKVFIDFVTILLLFYVLVFWPRGSWDHSSPTRDRTCTPLTTGYQGRPCTPLTTGYQGSPCTPLTTGCQGSSKFCFLNDQRVS